MSEKCCFLRCKIVGLKIRVCKKLDKYHVWPLGSPTRTPWPLGTPLTYPLNLDPLGPNGHPPWPPRDYLHAPFFLEKNDILAKKIGPQLHHSPLFSFARSCASLLSRSDKNWQRAGLTQRCLWHFRESVTILRAECRLLALQMLDTAFCCQHSWLPYSTYLYFDFHLLLCSMTKLKEHSREIC